MQDNKYNDPFKIPISNKMEKESQEKMFNISKKEVHRKVIRLNLDRIPVVKVGFELPEDDDQEIELIAVKKKKTKKDLLAEIVKEWLKKNKSKEL